MNTLRINVDPELLATGAYGAGALVRVERSPTGGGAGYSEIGTSAIVTGSLTVTYYDQTGITTHWYRVRYSNAGNTVQSDYGQEFQPVSSVAYTTPAYIKAMMGTTDTSDDPLLATIASQVNYWISEYCSNEIGPTDGGTIVLDGNGTDTLFVPTGIRKLTTLTMVLSTGTTPLSIPVSDFWLTPSEPNRLPGWPAFYLKWLDVNKSGYGAFTRLTQAITVTGDLGWASVPQTLIELATNVAVRKYRLRGAGGGESVFIGADGSRSFERSLSLDDKRTLDRFRVGMWGVG